jgi:hypothetical protein
MECLMAVDGATMHPGRQPQLKSRVLGYLVMCELRLGLVFTDFAIGPTPTVTLHENAGHELSTPRVGH